MVSASACKSSRNRSNGQAMGADKSDGVHMRAHTKGDKWRDRCACRGKNGDVWSGECPQSACMMYDRGSENNDGHGWMGSSECIGAAGTR